MEIRMSNRKRGRPKGTEIDDSDVLGKIAELIFCSPSLKPTTAIKRLGIYDESVIRRLREKWKKQREELLLSVTSKRKQTRSSGARYSRDANAPWYIDKSFNPVERFLEIHQACERAQENYEASEREIRRMEELYSMTAADRVIERYLEMERITDRLLRNVRY